MTDFSYFPSLDFSSLLTCWKVNTVHRFDVKIISVAIFLRLKFRFTGLSRIESYLVTALVFNFKEMMRFDAFGMRSISVACKDFVDRSAMCSSPQ